jgi:hypothetical protein
MPCFQIKLFSLIVLIGTVVKHSTRDPKISGSNPSTSTRREKRLNNVLSKMIGESKNT